MGIKNRAERVIGQGVLTNSKHWSTHIDGVYPTHIKASSGAHLIDTEGKKYLDFICGLGTNLIGYGHPLIEKEVDKYRYQGKSPSLPHVLEVEVAEELKEMFPWVEKWKFLKTGSEACSAAVRIARAFTGRGLIFSHGYHGWHDGFTSLTPPARGVCDSHTFMTIDQYDQDPDTAAVILEPVQIYGDEQRIRYLNDHRSLCTRNHAILIFDEVITGFRYRQFSVSRAYNIRPDLVVIGKAMANGYPLAAVGGSAEVMDSDYFVSSTYAGEISSLAAAKAVSRLLREDPKYRIDRLWDEGARFLKEFNSCAKELNFEIKGYPTRGIFQGDDKNIAIFMQEACLAGFLFGKSWFISFSHLRYLDQAIESCKDILMRMKISRPQLKGKMPQPPFAMRSRQ